MIRYIMAGGILLAGIGVALLPAASPPPANPAVGANPPPVAICPVEEGLGKTTTIGLMGAPNGVGRFSVFAGGSPTGTSEFSIGATGASTIPVVDVSAIGIGGGLAEVPDASTGVSALITGSGYLAAVVCESSPSSQTVLAGGSTVSGESHELQLSNPYAGDAVVGITVWSEAGVESGVDLSSVVVPARSSTIVDLRELFPGREIISVVIDTKSGSVIPFGRFGDGSDGALWQAGAPAQEWFITSPGGGGKREVVIATASPAEVSYEIDLYGPDGLVEGFDEGLIPARGAVTIDLGDVGRSALALRIFATAPVASFLRFDPDRGVAMTSGVLGAANGWLMPGAGQPNDSVTNVIVLNPGLEDASVTVSQLGESVLSQTLVVPATSVSVVPISPLTTQGVSLSSDMPIVATWVMRVGDSIALSGGIPIDDG